MLGTARRRVPLAERSRSQRNPGRRQVRFDSAQRTANLMTVRQEHGALHKCRIFFIPLYRREGGNRYMKGLAMNPSPSGEKPGQRLMLRGHKLFSLTPTSSNTFPSGSRQNTTGRPERLCVRGMPAASSRRVKASRSCTHKATCGCRPG